MTARRASFWESTDGLLRATLKAGAQPILFKPKSKTVEVVVPHRSFAYLEKGR
jgi:hypothetical protein